MPTQMVSNAESTVATNKLKQAAPGMKHWANEEVNMTILKVGVPYLEGGPPEMNRPANHPSNKAPGDPAQLDKSAPVQARNVPEQPTTHKIRLIADLGLRAFTFSCVVL